MYLPSRTPNLVMDAADRALSAVGHERLTIADIVLASGVSNGSVFHHFRSRDGVLQETLRRALRPQWRELRRLLHPRDADPRETIRAVIGTHVAWIERHPGHAELLLERPAFAPVRRADRDAVVIWLAVQGQAGRLPSTDVGLAGGLVLGPVHGAARMWLAGREPGGLVRHADRLAAAAWAGLHA